MATFAGGKIEAFVGPRELGGADDLERAIVDFIAGARRSLDVAVQELDSEPIAQALIDARWGGVDVRLFLEQDYLQSARLPAVAARDGETEEQARRRTQWTDEGRGRPENRRVLTALLRAGADVKADYNPSLFHQKFIVRDLREKAERTSALLTGSGNFTTTDTHANLNNVFVFHDHRICGDYRDEFERLRRGEFGRGRHGDVPRAYNLAGIPVRVLFAPDHTPELEVVKQMLKCRDRLDFAIFTFAGSSAIDDAMIMLRQAGRRIRGVLDPGQGAQWWAATRWLHDERIEVLLPRRENGLNKLHHKLMVIDDAIAVAGSMNYTAPANELNDENIFVLGSPYADLPRGEGGPVDLAACAELTGYLRTEIDRIAGDLSDPYQPPPGPPGPRFVRAPEHERAPA